MKLQDILKDKTIKAKQKVLEIGRLLIEKELAVDELVSVAQQEKETLKADCLEAMELASKDQPSLITLKAFKFVIDQLKASTPRIKWESARIIINTAQLYPDHLDDAIVNLLENAEHEGTVVRWSTATALAAIARLKTAHHPELVTAFETLGTNETKNSIAKIYKTAIKAQKIKL